MHPPGSRSRATFAIERQSELVILTLAPMMRVEDDIGGHAMKEGQTLICRFHIIQASRIIPCLSDASQSVSTDSSNLLEAIAC